MPQVGGHDGDRIRAAGQVYDRGHAAHRQVAPGEAQPVAQLLEHAPAADARQGRSRQLPEVDAALLRLPEELVQHGQLDGGGLREGLLRPDLERHPALQVLDREAEHAVETAIDRLDAGAELVPERGLLPGGRAGNGEARDEERQGRGHSCFHALSYLSRPVESTDTPWTARRKAVKSDTW